MTITIAEFEALTQKAMYQQLKDDFPEEAVGKSRARKDDLIAAYTKAVMEKVIEPGSLGIPDTPDDIGMPIAPQPSLPIPKGLENMPKAETKAQLPVRKYKGLAFVIVEGDPNRDLVRQEQYWLDDIVKYAPKLGQKLQTAPKGAPGRRIFDPHKRERKIVRDAIRKLEWAKILVLKEQKPQQPQAQVLQENF